MCVRPGEEKDGGLGGRVNITRPLELLGRGSPSASVPLAPAPALSHGEGGGGRKQLCPPSPTSPITMGCRLRVVALWITAPQDSWQHPCNGQAFLLSCL